MEKHIENYFFNSNQLPKLVKFNLEMERLRKKRVFIQNFKSSDEDLKEEDSQSSEIKRLLNNKVNPLLLVEAQPEEIDDLIEKSNTALTVIEESESEEIDEPEPKEISEDKLLLSQNLEKAHDVLAKSQEQRENEAKKEISEKEQMQQFLKDFIETVKEEKEKMAI